MIRSLLALTAAALVTTAAPAADFSFAGAFGRDNDKARFTFTLAAPATVTLASLGYAGGTNAAGTAIARGGFDTLLSVYGADGFLIEDNDDGANASTDTATNQALDAVLSRSFATGTYTAYLTQSSNYGPAFQPGAFKYDGEPNFAGGFVDFYGNQRTGGWALDISGVTAASAAVPEPSTWAMLLIGFGGIGAALRTRRRHGAQTAFA